MDRMTFLKKFGSQVMDLELLILKTRDGEVRLKGDTQEGVEVGYRAETRFSHAA